MESSERNNIFVLERNRDTT